MSQHPLSLLYAWLLVAVVFPTAHSSRSPRIVIVTWAKARCRRS
jgi:hypothetical protein